MKWCTISNLENSKQNNKKNNIKTWSMIYKSYYECLIGLGFPTLTLFFCHSSQILAPFPMKSNEGFNINISINPIFPIFFLFNFYFDCLGCLFCWSCSFFLMEHFSTFEELHHFHLLRMNPLVFFSTILFSHFLLYLSTLYLQESC